MSNKEKVVRLLDSVPEYKMGYVLAYIQGITADEEIDDLFCQKMLEDYQNDPDPEKDMEYIIGINFRLQLSKIISRLISVQLFTFCKIKCFPQN